MIRSVLVPCSLAVLAAGRLRAQNMTLPALPRLSCAAADQLLGPTSHEEDSRLDGDYDSHTDSTYLIAWRSNKTRRNFIPFSIAAFPGPGPFTPDGYELGLSLNRDAEEMVKAAGPLTARVVLDDFEAFDLGEVTLGSMSMHAGQFSTIALRARVPAAAWFKLLRAKSALVSWGRWHADLEWSDIGAYRGFTRALACAPVSFPQIAMRGFIPRPPGIAQPGSATPDGTSGLHIYVVPREHLPARLDLLVQRNSCAAADSILGPRNMENGGALGGEYVAQIDSTRAFLVGFRKGESFDYNFNTFIQLPGQGPFMPVGLALGFTVLNNLSTAAPWSDTMSVTLTLDDGLTLHLGHPLLSQPNADCCRAPMQITIVLTRAALLATLGAGKARLSWAGVSLTLNEGEIGALRALQRALICAPRSLDDQNMWHRN